MTGSQGDSCRIQSQTGMGVLSIVFGPGLETGAREQTIGAELIDQRIRIKQVQIPVALRPLCQVVTRGVELVHTRIQGNPGGATGAIQIESPGQRIQAVDRQTG